jgi:hypothetical protein
MDLYKILIYASGADRTVIPSYQELQAAEGDGLINLLEISRAGEPYLAVSLTGLGNHELRRLEANHDKDQRNR